MSKYNLVEPQDFLPEHKNYIAEFKESINLLTYNSKQVIGCKDINSMHLCCSNAYAELVGLEQAEDVAFRSDFDMPCEGTVAYAHKYVEEDQKVMETHDINYAMSVLNVHQYCNGTKALVFTKQILCHEETLSILGTVYSGEEIKMHTFANIIPNYIMRFGAIGSMAVANKYGDRTAKLNAYEQEICFLLMLNWDCGDIARFMNKFRPEYNNRNSDTISKKRNAICQKLHLDFHSTKDLCEYLFSVGFHNKMPESFYNKLIGSKIINPII